MKLAPPLLELEQTVKRVIEQGPVPQEELEAAFAQARGFLMESTGLFREVEETLVVDEEGLQKLNLCSQEMEHSLSALEKLQDAALQNKQLILSDRLQGFLTSRVRCLEYFADFSRLAAAQPIYSPVPIYDSFIKTGIKVVEKQLEKERLEQKFSILLPELHRVQRLLTLFPKLHQAPEDLLNGLNQSLQGLKTGYGAIATYFQSEDEMALKDGLKLLGSASAILHQQMQKAEELAGAEQRYSAFRPLEEWLRLKNYVAAHPQEEMPEAWITSTLSQVFFVWDFLLDQAGRLLNQPLLADVELADGLTQELFQEGLKVRGEADKLLAQLNGPALLSSEDQVWLQFSEPVTRLKTAVESTQAALEAQMAPFRELPGLEQIAGMKEQVKRGELQADVLKAELENQLERVEELLRSVEGAGDPFSTEFRDLLPLHRSAFLGMLGDLEEGNWQNLDSRWQGLLTTLPHLANLSRTIRRRLQSQTSSARMVTCLRCQAKNDPSRRVCSSCGATLPAVVQKMQTYSEIDLNEGREAVASASTSQNITPKAIELLENMVDGLETNRTTKKDASEALGLLIQDVDRQRQMFTKKLLPLMGKDEVMDSYLRYFAQGMGQYFANLVEMQAAVQDGALARIRSCLSQTRDTLETLDAMKERVDGALKA